MNTPVEDIRKESLISKRWNWSGHGQKALADGILVTGANSFIGCHVVRQLAEVFPGRVHLLLRAPNLPGAVLKMQHAFEQWGLGFFNPNGFFIHTGDVCAVNLGLTIREYAEIDREVGQVIHLAMTPMYHLPYHHFKRIWIPELERMIRFCGDPDHPKFLHYASSFNANFFQEEEDFMALNTNAWQSGYAGFKWVTNRAIANAMRQNLIACIYDIPLVLGSESNGLCPGHYSIWMILDIFLKTGLYFPFRFNIIPVDKLADVIVFNALKVKEGCPSQFSRPFMADPVDDELFARTAANLLGLQKAGLEEVRKTCHNKLRFDFMMPGNFYDLMKKVNSLPAVFPDGFERGYLPQTPMVFMSNLNRIMSVRNEMIKV